MDTLAIIKRIEMRLAEIGMSKADFYKQSGISSASYSQWNTGIYNPSKKKLKSAADCLNVSYEYLLYGAEIEKEKMPTQKDEHKLEISPAFFRLKQGLEPYNISEADADFLLEVYKAHIKKNRQE